MSSFKNHVIVSASLIVEPGARVLGRIGSATRKIKRSYLNGLALMELDQDEAAVKACNDCCMPEDDQHLRHMYPDEFCSDHSHLYHKHNRS